MNTERMNKLVEAVEATPDAEWDMSVWAEKKLCGTVGCAAGNYVMRNPDCGMEIVFMGEYAEMGFIEQNQTSIGLAELAVHFGVTYLDAEKMFQCTYRQDPTSITRSAVLARIREVMSRYTVTP